MKTSNVEETVAKLLDYIEMSSDWFWEQDSEFRFIEVHALRKSILKSRMDNIIGNTRWDDLSVDFEKNEHWKSHIDDLIAHRTFHDFLYSVTDEEGNERFLTTSGKPIFDEGGKFSGYRGSSSDITDLKQRENSLRENEEQYKKAAKIAHLGHWVWDAKEDKCISCSNGLAEIHGASIEKFLEITNSIEDGISWVHPDDREQLLNIMNESIKHHKNFDTEYRIVLRDGTVRYVHEVGEPIFDVKGVHTQTHGITQNITESKLAEESIRISEERLRLALENMTGGIFMINIDMIIQVMSPSFQKLYDVPEALCQPGKPLRDIVHYRAERGDYGPGDPELNTEKRTQEYFDNKQVRLESKLHDDRIVEVFRAPTKDGGIVVVYNDVTERKKAEAALQINEQILQKQVVELKYSEERLKAQAVDLITLAENLEAAKQEMQHMANHDALTGLPSLRLCKDRLENAMAADRRNKTQSAVLFIDLDGFKVVNDSLGHKAGDDVLKGVAERLKSSIREMDTAARIGGDEFILVLPETGDKGAIAKVAQKIIDKISEPFPVDGGVANIGASIGIAFSPDDGAAPEELLRNADASMYVIKKQGKNNYGFFT